MGKKVMILSASAGNGHVRAAQALEEACSKDERISELVNLDALAYTNKPFQKIYSRGYLEAVKAAPDLWAFAFDSTDKPWRTPGFVRAMHKINSQPLVKKIKEFQPDICLCTHGMPAEIISELILQDKIQTNLGIVVTDYYVHALWFFDIFTRYFVPKEESKIHMSTLGIPPDRIVVSGIPVMDAFSKKVSKKALREKLGIHDSLPVVLLSAGAFGVMSAADIMRILCAINARCHIIVICGKNEKLKNSLDVYIAENKRTLHNSYTIIGFTDAIHEYMKAADLFIGKPGGLSSTECMVSGLPMVIWDPIPGQEIYNTYHILENGAGVMPSNALTIGAKVDEVLASPERLGQMKQNALSISRPHAAAGIVNAMLEHENETPVKAFKRIL